ncbi:MAG: prohibitin family protein, partial [Candidatus Gastranaerophilales bacterium]|nr:prohibitin family protein [Candidatus Gastranaerophilales bacterium]
DGVECLTADGQKVKLNLSVIYNLEASEVWRLHQEIGQTYLVKVLRPQVRSISRSIVSSYPVMDLYSEKRLAVQQDIQDKLKKELKKYHINIQEVLIRTVTFSDEFAKAVEQKQVALQEAERMRYVLQKEESEKQRKIIEAQGEAEAIGTKGSALKANPLLIQYEYVNKISPGIKTIITDQNAIMNFPDSMFEK